jgi:hypothetical protein
MKLALRILVTALLVGLLAVPAASAKPGGGKGHGKGAEKAKAAHEHKAGKEKKAKKDKSAEEAGRADKAKKNGKKADAESCEAPSAAAAVLSGLFGLASECSTDEQEQAAEALEPPNLDGLGPGQYCHQLEAWMVAGGGDFSQTFGTAGSGYANDHGACASRRAHGEDLAPAAFQSVCDAAKAAGGELPEACKPAEEQQAEQAAPAAAELSTVLRLLSF